MDRKQLAGYIIIASTIFVLGWALDSTTNKTLRTQAHGSEVWLPQSLDAACKIALKDIYANTTAPEACALEVKKVTDSPKGVCKNFGATALIGFVCNAGRKPKLSV